MVILICPKIPKIWWKSIQSPLSWKQSLNCLTPKKRWLWEGGIGHGPYGALRIAMAHIPSLSTVQIQGGGDWSISLFCLLRIAFPAEKDYPSGCCDTCVLITRDRQNLMENIISIACKLQKKHLKILLKSLFESRKLFCNQKVLRKALITKIYKIIWCFIYLSVTWYGCLFLFILVFAQTSFGRDYYNCTT